MGCFPLHLGDVAIIGLDLSQYHKLGRPKALPLDLNKFRDPLWMLPDTTPYSILKALPDPQETHPQQARGELVDFTDGLGSFLPPSLSKIKQVFLCLKQSSVVTSICFLKSVSSFPRRIFMWHPDFTFLFYFFAQDLLCYLCLQLRSTWQQSSGLFFFPAAPSHTWTLSSSTRNWTHTLCTRSSES